MKKRGTISTNTIKEPKTIFFMKLAWEWSLDLVKFLTTAGRTNEIEPIIRKAQQQLVLVSLFLQLSTIFQKKGVL